MKFKFLIFFLLLFFFQNISSAIDYGNYLAGRYALSKKDYEEAIIFLEQASDINNIHEKSKEYDLDIQKELCNLYLLTGKINKCVSIAQKIQKHLPETPTMILLTLIMNDIKKRNFNSALEKTKKVKKDSYERFSIPIIKAWVIAIEKKNYKKSIETINELEQDFAINGLRYLHMALINEYFEKYDEANIFYEKSINSFSSPSFRLVQLAGNSFERSGKIEKAKKLYLKFAKDSNDKLLISSEIDRLNKKIIPNKKIHNLSDAMAELFTNISSTFRSDFTNKYSIIYTNFALYFKNDFEIGLIQLAELLENEDKFLLANQIYKQISPRSIFNWHARIRKARNLEILGNNKEAVSLLNQMSEEKKDRYDSLQLLGDILRNYKKYSEAIKVYNKAISRIPEINESHWNLLYSRGIAYERFNKWEEAEQDFLKVLNLVPNEAEVLNYLGYSWIEKGINIKEAKDFLIKANRLRPSDPYVVDSLGWAYYKLQDYDNAVRELERAVSLNPTDPIINDHLGDAYEKKERILEAYFQWKKALDFKPEDKLKKQIEMKLKNFTKNSSINFKN